jgi:hypothetical protein
MHALVKLSKLSQHCGNTTACSQTKTERLSTAIHIHILCAGTGLKEKKSKGNGETKKKETRPGGNLSAVGFILSGMDFGRSLNGLADVSFGPTVMVAK